MTALAWEQYHPYLIAILCAIGWYHFGPDFPKSNDILSASLTVAAILIGFLATAKSLLMTLNSPVLCRLSQAGYIDNIASYMAEGIYTLFVLCSWAMVGYFIDTGWHWYGIAWISLVVCGVLTFLRVTKIMLKLFKKRDY